MGAGTKLFRVSSNKSLKNNCELENFKKIDRKALLRYNGIEEMYRRVPVWNYVDVQLYIKDVGRRHVRISVNNSFKFIICKYMHNFV